eukprot:751896-Hanusia_phi.AAC.4
MQADVVDDRHGLSADVAHVLSDKRPHLVGRRLELLLNLFVHAGPVHQGMPASTGGAEGGGEKERERRPGKREERRERRGEGERKKQ